MRHSGRFDWQLAGIIGVITGIVALSGLGIWKYAEHRAKCTDNGGHWETYDCHTEHYTQCHHNGSGEVTICLPATRRVCSERCVGVRAEKVCEGTTCSPINVESHVGPVLVPESVKP